VRALRHVSRASGDRSEGSLTLGTAAVCVFPGQGAQRVGMGRDLAESFACARAVFAEVDERLGTALSRLCFEGPAEALALTENAQPAILAASVAAHRVLVETTGVRPAAVAGHSLGEWSALVVAGALELADAAFGVRERGRLMQAAVPVGEGAMAALLGADLATVEALCAEAAQGQVVAPANLNGGGQVVVAGHTAAVDRVVALAAARRVRAQKLAVSAPFHCSLMRPAADGLRPVLAGLRFSEPAIPVVTSVEARVVTSAAELPGLLERQVTAPVRWEETARALAGRDVRVALEVGPGRTLAGLMKRIVPELPCVPAGDADGIRAAAEALA
jgi:[acyl-carrier-protein] S-malonyltransferase